MRYGFTLIELLVVVAIVAVLACIAVPVIKTVRSAALAAGCKSNMREVGLSFLAYASDHHGQFPADGYPSSLPNQQCDGWYQQLPDYLEVSARNRVFQCPGYRQVSTNNGFTAASPKSLKMNSYLDSDDRPRYFRPLMVADATEIMLMVDAIAGSTGVGQWGYATTNSVTDSRHKGRINMLMADGMTLVQQPMPTVLATLPWKSASWPK